LKSFEVGRQDLAKVLRLTPRQINNLVDRGLPTVMSSDGKRKLYDLTTAVPWFVEYREGLQRNTEKEEAETRERKAKAALAELELGERTGELVRLSLFETILGEVLDDIRANLLNLPGRVAPQFPDPREAMTVLVPAVDDCLGSLRALADKYEDRGGDPLPDGFPAVKPLRKAGLRTFQALRRTEDLQKIPGIGPALEKRISAELQGVSV